MRLKGVEPIHLAALDPKSSVSTNSTTGALNLFFEIFLRTYLFRFAGAKICEKHNLTNELESFLNIFIT